METDQLNQPTNLLNQKIEQVMVESLLGLGKALHQDKLNYLTITNLTECAPGSMSTQNHSWSFVFTVLQKIAHIGGQ